MEPIVLKPEKEQKTMWFICWAIPFVIGLTVWTVLLLVVEPLIFGLCLVGWLILMFLIVLWIPAFYNSLEYVIDIDSVRARAGVFWRKRVTIPFNKITNIDITQGPIQRIFDIGTVHVQTAGAGGQQGAQAELRLLGIRQLEEIKDAIMERTRDHSVPDSDRIKENDYQILGRVLEELTAIRKVLERKRS